MTLLERVTEFLRNKEFVHIATCDFHGHPNAAPKLFVKIKKNYIYVVDYTIGKTWENIKVNPQVSLSFVEPEELTCYQLNGPVEIIEKGSEYENARDDLLKKEISLSSKRIVEGMIKGKSHKHFEVGIPERHVFFKIKVEEIAEIGPRGEIKRERNE